MGILLQLGEVTRSKKPHAPSAEVINDRSGERSPFGGIGPRPRFVKKDQVAALDQITKALSDLAHEVEELQGLAGQIEAAASKPTKSRMFTRRITRAEAMTSGPAKRFMVA